MVIGKPRIHWTNIKEISFQLINTMPYDMHPKQPGLLSIFFLVTHTIVTVSYTISKSFARETVTFKAPKMRSAVNLALYSDNKPLDTISDYEQFVWQPPKMFNALCRMV